MCTDGKILRKKFLIHVKFSILPSMYWANMIMGPVEFSDLPMLYVPRNSASPQCVLCVWEGDVVTSVGLHAPLGQGAT